jgi:hypothetical protein
MSAGEPVNLQVAGARLIVYNRSGEYLSEIEPRYGLRLAKLIDGGNQYVAAISGLSSQRQVKVILASQALRLTRSRVRKNG